MNIRILDLVECDVYSDGPYIKDELLVKRGPPTSLSSARCRLVGQHFVHLLWYLIHQTLHARLNLNADGAANSFPHGDSGRTTYGVRMAFPVMNACSSHLSPAKRVTNASGR